MRFCRRRLSQCSNSKRFTNKLFTILAVSVAMLCTGCSTKVADEQQAIEVAQDSAGTQWFKSAVIYTLDVEVFKDSDDDGVGDLKGLISKLEYISGLGADAIWLAPFQPTPNKDDGYDVSDYYSVDKRLGTMEDFVELIRRAESLNIRILMDLVVNHTSDQHPWFAAARDKNSSYRDWYTWSDEKPDNFNVGMVFPGVQESIWTMDTVSGEYYYHRFYKFQPDLNMQNEAVRNEVRKVVKFWLSKGVKGFRLDAVPFVIEVPDTRGDKFDRQFGILTDLRTLVDSLDKEAIILGEANVLPEENKDYFGKDGTGINMMFNFYVNQRLFYALATGRTSQLKEALESTRTIPARCEWGQFLRNHDEVDLGRLTDEQRNEVYKVMGPEKRMQLYDRGIRRRLAPMLKNDRRWLELAYSMLLALPSTPVFRYGDEIGMGDNLALPERMSVRTPMQWDDSPQAGFTRSSRPVLPIISKGEYAYTEVNVSDAAKDSTSLLKWTQDMIALRKQCPEIAFGEWRLIDCGVEHVLGLLYTFGSGKLFVLHNFSPDNQTATFDLGFEPIAFSNLRQGGVPQVSNGRQHSLPMKGFSYYWMKVQ